jgi:hypothetical protein
MVIKYWDNVLTEEELKEVDAEMDTMNWTKHFDRAGSSMLECNSFENCPILKKLYLKHSTLEFLEFLEKELDIVGILPDPHMIGSGYSEISSDKDLKPHVDFNWNDRIKMYRVASYIIYLTTLESGGEIEFIDVQKVKTQRNRAVLFEHSEEIRHFVHPVKGVRRAVRFFFYCSKAERPENYHRSLYGWNNGMPTDIK